MRTLVTGELIERGSVAFSAGDTLTTEKKSSAVTITDVSTKYADPTQNFLLAIEKATEDTAGDLTIKVYNVITVNATARDVLLTEFTVDVISGAASYECAVLQGLFVGDGQIKVSATFATDSGAITVYFALYRM